MSYMVQPFANCLVTTIFVCIPLVLSREDMMTSVYVDSIPEDLLGVHLALEEMFGGVGTIKVTISGNSSRASVNSVSLMA